MTGIDDKEASGQDPDLRSGRVAPTRPAPQESLGRWARLSTGTRQRYRGSVAQAFLARLKTLDFFKLITLFGAAFLFSTLPLIIILGSLADRDVDSDLSHHLGLNAQAAKIVSDLFVTSSAHSTDAVVIALVLSLAGTIALAASVQTTYEQVFGAKQRHRMSNIIRLSVWVAGFCTWLLLDAVVSQVFTGMHGGFLAEGAVIFVGSTVFLWWSMRFLLAGRVPWETLLRPAVVTALFWIGLDWFASIYFSSTVISDSQLYGKVGVIFSLLTWFIAIAAVVVLGAATGAVWEDRRHGSH